MELLSVVRNTFPEPVDGPRSIYNLTGSSAALFLALKRKPFVAIEKDEAHAETLAKDIAFFRMIFSGPKVLFLPDPDGAEAAGVRSEILLKLQSSDSLVTSSNNLFSNLWDREQVSALSLEIRKGGLKSRALFEEDLIMLGYHKVPMVVERGEYSQRGWIIDVFPSTSGDPLRVEFFGDEIEQVRTFDVETQKSREEKDEFLLLPAIELDERRSLSELVSEKVFYCLDSVQEKNGLPGDTVFLSRYSFKTGTAADGQEREKEEIPQTEAGMLSFSGCGVLPEERKGIGDLPEVLKILAQKHRIILVASSSGQAERLRDVFRERDVIAPFVDINELHDYAGTISITIGGLSAGLFFEGLLVLTEKELFGERPAFRPIKKSKLTNLL
ncbi:MAG: hypothetical protein HZA17_08785, partial [Nitrospirae bacterium]|nr:hypothetical protein [Nitrospirota bacterium]